MLFLHVPPFCCNIKILFLHCVHLILSRFAAPDGFHHIKPQPTMKDGIAKVKTEIKSVMGIMQGNISKVLDRGAKLEDLQDKSGIVVERLVSTSNATHFVHFNFIFI